MNKNEQIFYIADRCLQKIREENPDDALLVSYIGDAINEAFDKIPSAKETLTESQFHKIARKYLERNGDIKFERDYVNGHPVMRMKYKGSYQMGNMSNFEYLLLTILDRCSGFYGFRRTIMPEVDLDKARRDADIELSKVENELRSHDEFVKQMFRDEIGNVITAQEREQRINQHREQVVKHITEIAKR